MAELCECGHLKSYHNEVGCGGVVEKRSVAILNYAACGCVEFHPEPAEPVSEKADESKCAECGHEKSSHVLIDGRCGWWFDNHDACPCQSYRPDHNEQGVEPKCDCIHWAGLRVDNAIFGHHVNCPVRPMPGETDWVEVAKAHVAEHGTVSAEGIRKLNEPYKDAILSAIDRPPTTGSAGESVEAWEMLAHFEMSGNHWRDRDTVQFAIAYATKLLAERDEADKERDRRTVEAFIEAVEKAHDKMRLPLASDARINGRDEILAAMRSVARELGVEDL